MTLNTLPIERYDAQLQDKSTHIAELFSKFSAPTAEIFASAREHYRMRAEFRIWHEGENLYHIMFNSMTKQRIKIDQFPMASQLINQLMVALLGLIRHQPELRHRLFQIDYLSTLSNKAIITLLYHRQLNDEWIDLAKKLRQQLQQQDFDVQIIGRASKQKICIEHDYIDEVLTINGQELIYRQVENSFTQPNAHVNIKMLSWALDITQNSQGDLLELYCGNGNFSLALAKNFRKVLATEIAKPSVTAAQYNIEANHIDNVQIIRMSAEEFTQAINGTRSFNRLKGIDLMTYNCDTIFVDPPRSGLDEQTLAMVQKYKNIIYISCNPQTLAENLEVLTQTHKINRLALFDQFPYTQHIECGVFLNAHDK